MLASPATPPQKDRTMEDRIEGPAWDLDSEYTGPTADELEADLSQVTSLCAEIEALNPALDGDDRVATAQRIFKLRESASRLLADPSVFASCLLSVNSRDAEAQNLQGRLQAFQKRLADAAEPLNQFCDLATDEEIEGFLADPEVAPAEFLIRHSRERRHELLSLPEESLVNGLSQDGIHAWGRLYSQLSGTLQCEVTIGNEQRRMGIAEATGLMQRPDDALRKNAWQAINTAWEDHEESCAAAINAIAGWRLEMCRKRSREKPVHFLDAPVHMNRIRRETLDAILAAAETYRPLARRAARLEARAYGKEAIGPWDNRAPAPVLDPNAGEGIRFDRAVDIIANAYAQVDQSLGEFVRMMVEKHWVEGTIGDSKRPGAYCTGFRKSRTPRVYMTYTGGASDVITLAHELGHAYHSWVMRDLPESQLTYGMSLAETASTFGETLVRDAMLAQADSLQTRLDVIWEDMTALVAFVLNIPTRFEFERRFYEARDGRPLRPEELKSLMNDAWQTWYGDAVSEPDPMFWASKLHFFISGLSFYNFPYLFGYLFSLGVYASRAKFGTEFFARYQALLRDTGRMTAEALAAKHLDADLTKPDFWEETLAAIEPRVDTFQSVLEEAGFAA
ncbi:MAG: M3 family oligoendopeptidase [Pseudomonadales bacterium]